jgi:hypothetical protein
MDEDSTTESESESSETWEDILNKHQNDDIIEVGNRTITYDDYILSRRREYIARHPSQRRSMDRSDEDFSYAGESQVVEASQY